MFASVDSGGFLSLFGFRMRRPGAYELAPDEQFFHSDYRQVTRVNNTVYDATNPAYKIATHLQPLPFLISAAGQPLELKYQRMLPGRAGLTSEQLAKHVVERSGGLIPLILDDFDLIVTESRNGKSEEAPAPLAATQTLEMPNDWVKSLVPALGEAALKESEALRAASWQREQEVFDELDELIQVAAAAAAAAQEEEKNRRRRSSSASEKNGGKRSGMRRLRASRLIDSDDFTDDEENEEEEAAETCRSRDLSTTTSESDEEVSSGAGAGAGERTVNKKLRRN